MPNLLDDLSKNDADLLPLVKKTDGIEGLITALRQKYPPPQAEGGFANVQSPDVTSHFQPPRGHIPCLWRCQKENEPDQNCQKRERPCTLDQE